MTDKHLTPRKINYVLNETSNDNVSDLDLSAESEVFDSYRDPEYFPSDDSDTNKKSSFSRLFQKRFERQLENDRLAGPSTKMSYIEDISDDESEKDKKLKNKRSRKRKKPLKKGAERKKKFQRKQKYTKMDQKAPEDNDPSNICDNRGKESEIGNSQDQDMVVRSHDGIEEVDNNAITEEDDDECIEDIADDDDSDGEEEELDADDSEKNKDKSSKKRNKASKMNEYKLNVFGVERTIKWEDWQGRQKTFPFTGNAGMNPEISAKLANQKPIDYFFYFLDEEVINLMVDETNLYATKTLLKEDNVLPQSRLHDWQPTDATEMRKFIGLLGWMGLVKFQNLRDYWSKKKLYDIPLARNIMSRNRFELLLKMWHFSDNTMAGKNRLFKIENIMNMFIARFKEAYTPSETVCIDKSMIPWRGRLVFRQYNPRKRHRYGIKLYKLCTGKGYTWNFDVYIGKDMSPNLSASENVVYKLLGGLLDGGKQTAPGGLLGEGRVLIIDNWYTSVPLAIGLLEHSTHLVGTLRVDRKYLPLAATTTLGKGDILTKETDDRITFLKWKDKRDVCLLSTVHTNETVEVTTKTNRVVIKPKDVVVIRKIEINIIFKIQLCIPLIAWTVTQGADRQLTRH